mgnify:CR=1 FL=1
MTRAILLLALNACGAIETVGDRANVNACCLAADPRECALDRIDPGERWELACGVTVDFPRVSRWVLAERLAAHECATFEETHGYEDPPCVWRTARSRCDDKYSTWCEATVDDGPRLVTCLEQSGPGHIEPVCEELF